MKQVVFTFDQIWSRSAADGRYCEAREASQGLYLLRGVEQSRQPHCNRLQWQDHQTDEVWQQHLHVRR